MSENALINYNVKYKTIFWNDFNETNTTERNLTIPNLRPGTRYDFNVSVVAGHLSSDPETHYTHTGKETRFCLFMKQTFDFLCFMIMLF